MSRRKKPTYFHLLPIHDEPFYGYILLEEDRCLNRYPDCPTIRCQKKIHSTSYVCHAVSVKPYYYSLFWQGTADREER